MWADRALTVHVGGGHTLIAGHGGRLGKRNLTGYSSDDMIAYCPEDESASIVTSRVSLRQMPMEESSQIQSVLAGSDFVANGTMIRNGTTLYRYETDGNTTLSSLRTISATILVDEDGLIHEFSGKALTSDRFTSKFDYRFSVVSSPPKKPSWMDTLPRVEYRVNATEITLEHLHGGERIPAGTNVSVRFKNDTVLPRATIQLPKSLGDGDVAHLTATVSKDSESGKYRASGNATVNRPPTSKSGMNYSDWTVGISFKTDQWYVNLWNSEKNTSAKYTNSSESTTTDELPSILHLPTFSDKR